MARIAGAFSPFYVLQIPYLSRNEKSVSNQKNAHKHDKVLLNYDKKRIFFLCSLNKELYLYHTYVSKFRHVPQMCLTKIQEQSPNCSFFMQYRSL